MRRTYTSDHPLPPSHPPTHPRTTPTPKHTHTHSPPPPPHLYCHLSLRRVGTLSSRERVSSRRPVSSITHRDRQKCGHQRMAARLGPSVSRLLGETIDARDYLSSSRDLITCPTVARHPAIRRRRQQFSNRQRPEDAMWAQT